jgi:hypothetical protein
MLPRRSLPRIAYSAVGAMLIISTLPITAHGYYAIVRVVTCCSATLSAYDNRRNMGANVLWFWFFLAIAILFNPIVPVPMVGLARLAVDLSIGVLFFCMASK